MQAIPVPVKNVSIYAYFDPTEPIEEIVIEGASGTYAVGTLTTNVFYNLDLNDDGKRVNPLNVHSKYYAVGETEDGKKFTTPWMFCLDNSSSPKFGRTISLFDANDNPEYTPAAPAVVDASEYIRLAPLYDITVSHLVEPPAIGQEVLIQNGKGYIIGTRIGTPHLMGVEVDSGDRTSRFFAGLKNIIITGKTEKGTLISRQNLTVVSAGNPALFLEEFFG